MQGLARLVTAAALAWGAVYLGWRALATAGDADLAARGILWAVETIGFVAFAIRAWQAWPSRSNEAVPAGSWTGSSTDGGADGAVPAVVIDATGAAVADLRTTLVAVRAMSGRPDVLVVDERADRWLRSVAERLGAKVLHRDVDLDTGLIGAGREWVLYLRVGDIPAADLFHRAAGFATDDVAVVQLGVADVDTLPLDDGPGPESPVEAVERQIVRPRLAARTSLPWYGDGPALIRSGALAAVGGAGPSPEAVPGTVGAVATDADRWWRTGLRLTAANLRITTVPGPLVRVRSLRTAAARLGARREINSRRVRSLFGGRVGRLGWQARAAHLAAAAGPPLGAVGRMLQILTLMLVLVGGQTPLAGSTIAVAAWAGPVYGLRWVGQLMLGAGRLQPLSLLRSDMWTLAADLGSWLPPGSPGSRWFGHCDAEAGGKPARPVLLIGVMVAVGATLVAGVLGTGWVWSSGLSRETAAIALALGSILFGVTAGVIADALGQSQRRSHRRVRLGMVTCRVEEHEGFLVDLSSGGVSVALPAPGPTPPTPDSVTTLAFRVPSADGRWPTVSTIVRVVRSSTDPEGGVRLGLEFDDPTAAPLDAVAEFLAAGPPRREFEVTIG